MDVELEALRGPAVLGEEVGAPRVVVVAVCVGSASVLGDVLGADVAVGHALRGLRVALVQQIEHQSPDRASCMSGCMSGRRSRGREP